MKYKELTYQKNFHVSLEDRYLMETIITTVSIEEGEDEVEVSKKAKGTLEKIHRENNPQLYVKQDKKLPTVESNGVVTNYINQSAVADKPTTYTKPTIPLSKEQKAEQLLKEQIANTITQINEITDPVVLKTFERLAMKHEPTKEAYNKRLKELTQ